MTRTAHIIGAGLAGLSAALRLTQTGFRVRLYEAGAQAGGRARSYVDEMLGCRIDNGNHLLLSGNQAALDYLTLIGARDSLTGPAETRFPFIDLATGARWQVAPNDGALPFWLFDSKRRVAGTRPLEYLDGLKLANASKTDTVAGLLGRHRTLYRRFWEPLAVAALNTEADTAAAHLLWPVVKETFGRGGAYCRPLVVSEGLSESFVLPALDWLGRYDGAIRFGARVRRLIFEDNHVAGIEIGGETITVGANDAVVLAVPPPVASDLVPELTVPTEFRGIVNLHYRVPEAMAAQEISILGIVGGTAEWVFRRERIISITISAATRVIDRDADELAASVWSEVATALDLGAAAMPPARVVKEKRATFAHTPAQIARRPAPATRWHNLALAGDWTDTKLPATIEGTIRSGAAAAQQVMAHLHR
jgi:squalene-associated FAD-dependent desaturase